MKQIKNEDNSEKSNTQLFDWYIQELNNLYARNQSKAVNVAKKGLRDLGVLKPSFSEYFPGITPDKLIIAGLCFFIVLCGFLALHISSFFTYIFGCIFFFAGLFIGLNVPGVGLIFLVSHGGSGLFMMIASLLGGFEEYDSVFDNFLNNPVFTDGGIPKTMIIYIGVTIAIMITAFIYTIFHNLSPVLKDNKKHMIRILLLFCIGFLLVGLFPKIFFYIF